MNGNGFFEFMIWNSINYQTHVLREQATEQNRLLEQLRRNCLAPQERAAEDNALEAARDSRKQDDLRTFRRIGFALAVLIPIWIGMIVYDNVSHETRQTPIEQYIPVTAAPRAELVR